MEPFIRPYAPTDLDAVYDICVRTAADGGDARGTYSTDLLMGDLYAAPYVTLEPEHAYVLDDGTGRAVGYVLGTADTPTFVRRYRDEWIPRVAHRYPVPTRPPATPEEATVDSHHHPERMVVPALADHPAHLHIDLLPRWQGQGHGRRLMARFLTGLHAVGVPSVYLAMSATNLGARRFYERLGFTEAVVPDPGPLVYLTRPTTPPC
ncbi:GNAT family N-acetyltransferase [Micromonospora sp. NPDC000207]|uniref:GNAT family N-acetyltransferase n=1 Tax=Micromonospora sp. NPDC000207 TaxID=3154246 RepID=UPI0033340A02